MAAAGSDGADPYSTREGQLDRLMAATGEVVGGELDPEVALRRLSEAAQRFIPHTLVDIGWIEEAGRTVASSRSRRCPRSSGPARWRRSSGPGWPRCWSTGSRC